jgi:hypothetical protein
MTAGAATTSTHAKKGGATVALVSGWVTEWKNMYGARVEMPDVPAIESGPIVPTTTTRVAARLR